MKLLALALITLSMGTAHAAQILVEPYLGYNTGKHTQDGSSTNLTGVDYGARLGADLMGLQFGINYMTGKWDNKSTPSTTLTPENLGVFVGYSLPILVRAYAEYDFAAKLKNEIGSTVNKYEGNAMKLGVGFKLIPLVTLNLEYLTSTYTKVNGLTLDHNLTGTVYSASVSVPLMW